MKVTWIFLDELKLNIILKEKKMWHYTERSRTKLIKLILSKIIWPNIAKALKTKGPRSRRQKVKNQFNGRTCTTYFAGKYRLLNGIKRCHDTQHNDIQHNDTQHNGLIYDSQQSSIACHYAECLNFLS